MCTNVKKHITHIAVVTKTVDLDVNQIPTSNHSKSLVSLGKNGVSQMGLLSCGMEWRFVGARLGPVPLLSSHSLGEPVSWGQLGGTVSCLKSSQFTGPFKVSTPTRGLQDYKNYKHWAVQAPIWDTLMHTFTHRHTHTPTVNSPFIFGTMERQ